jgi:structural maintenance of chromosome 3 (chondroitin sulfate proteoglycan 6)
LTGPFSAGHNVIVGRNGSGKSNFFDAVRFLLADSFANLRGEERVALLHEGAGASVLSAYVEMVFDNADGRLPFDKDTVALRRMVGLQKDEYVLDRKNVTRTEVFNLLESAGFSRSNPYYIVQQGKVAALCAMSDRNRLDLLKEVAGTRVYDDRREESLRIMDETDAKRDKISEVVDYIEARLAELDSEKDELKAFQTLDRDRRALEYTIFVKELDEAKAALEGLTAARAERTNAGHDVNARLLGVQHDIAAADRDAKTSKAELKRAVQDRGALDDARRAAVATVAKLDVDVAEARLAATSAEEAVRHAQDELASVERLVFARREELSPLEEKFDAIRQSERSTRSKAAELEASVLALRVKADRVNQFSSIEERNIYLRREIKESRKSSDAARRQRTKAESDVARLEATLQASKEKISAREAEIGAIEERTGTFEAELTALRLRRDAVHAQRHEKWRLDAEYDGKINALTGNLKRLEAVKRSAFGAGTYHAIKTVMAASHADPQRLGSSRVFGPLVDLLRVDDKFTVAADVTAGNSLTHVVVDSDATAARLVRVLQEQRAGRVTFIPLNRLGSNSRPPPPATADAIPLISKISCDDRFLPAVAQIFGRTLVTRSVDVATQLSRDHDVDCVTLEGDQVNKQGAMTGGFVDLSRSKIDASRELRRGEEELAVLQPQASLARQEAAEIDAQLSKLLGEIQQRDATHRSSTTKTHRLRAEIDQLTRYARLDGDNIPKAKDRVLTLEESIAASDKRCTELDSELSVPMTSGLAPDEEATLQKLQGDADVERQRVAQVVAERVSIESAVTAIKSELEGNLERRSAELRSVIASQQFGGSDGGVVVGGRHDATRGGDNSAAEKNNYVSTATCLANHEQELASAKTELSSAEAALRLLDDKVADLETVVSGLTAKLDASNELEAQLTKQLEADRTRAESMFSKRAMLLQKKSDAERKIRELGSLPADYDKHRSSSIGSLMKQLKRTNEGLKRYAHVNKKALDQFISFTEQREALCKRREELETGADAIRKLIDSLDNRKDADILRTFKGVSKYFSEVFSELVPGGRASLVMLKASSGGGNGDNGAAVGAAALLNRVVYTGVAMKVAFSSTGEAYLLQQLSGGQKSIVALALIFAIQRLDPAPFYLFDEIDANLDATYRQAVANVIRKQSGDHAQFITTTFRPEFVNAGEKWFGVTHRNKVSTVQEVTLDVALTFVNKDETK